jgi:hypothetical protein
LLTIVFLLSFTAVVVGQQEIVPAEERIYRFLHTQRTAGQLSEYRHEMRPHSRGYLLELLDSLEVHREQLSTSGRYWLDYYREELEEPEDRIETVLSPEGIRRPRRTNSIKYFYYTGDNAWRLAVRGGAHLDSRYGRDSLTYRGEAIAARLEIQGNYRQWVGFYSNTFNGFQFSGDRRVLKKDPVLRPLYYVSRSETPVGNFDRTTASVRIGRRQIAAELANERLLIGPGYSAPIILGGNADYFPFLRLSTRAGALQYQYIHGSLGDRHRTVFSEEHPGRGVLVGTDRSLALHRVSVHPSPALSLAFTEWVVYGQRGLDLAYLNPVFPFTTAEHALWDRDNVLFALDGIYRPIPGVETFGALLIDDLDFAKVGRHSYNVKLGYQAGIGFTRSPGVLGWLTYTRIDPFVYTHRFELEGSFYNSYHHNGFTLGHPVGPNADRLELGLQYWFPARLKASVRLQYTRRGENFVGENGETVNVGGDPVNGMHPSYSELSKRFLAGGTFSGPGAGAELSWEPIRDLVRLELTAYWQRWNYGGIRPLHGHPSPPDESIHRVHATDDDEVFVHFRTTIGL